MNQLFDLLLYVLTAVRRFDLQAVGSKPAGAKDGKGKPAPLHIWQAPAEEKKVRSPCLISIDCIHGGNPKKMKEMCTGHLKPHFLL